MSHRPGYQWDLFDRIEFFLSAIIQSAVRTWKPFTLRKFYRTSWNNCSSIIKFILLPTHYSNPPYTSAWRAVMVFCAWYRPRELKQHRPSKTGRVITGASAYFSGRFLPCLKTNLWHVYILHTEAWEGAFAK